LQPISATRDADFPLDEMPADRLLKALP